MRTRGVGWLLLVPLIAAALFGGNAFGLRDHFFPAPTNLSTTTLNNAAGQALSHQNELPAEPYWVPVANLSGNRASTGTVSIAADALQWRVDWQCTQGSLSVNARSSAGSQPVVQRATCPGSGSAYAVNSGRFILAVTATSGWTLNVVQQLDRPANAPPLPAMTAPGASVVATGSFYGVDQQGQGTVRIYRLADGSSALRLENFYVTPNTDFEITLSVLPRPTSTPQYLANLSANLAPLPYTAGSQNFAVPPNLNPQSYRSVVIWCERLTSAYAAATLQTA